MREREIGDQSYIEQTLPELVKRWLNGASEKDKDNVVEEIVDLVKNSFGFSEELMSLKIQELPYKKNNEIIKSGFEGLKDFLVSEPGILTKIFRRENQEDKLFKKIVNPKKLKLSSTNSVSECLKQEINRKLLKYKDKASRRYSPKQIANIALSILTVGIFVALMVITAYVPALQEFKKQAVDGAKSVISLDNVPDFIELLLLGRITRGNLYAYFNRKFADHVGEKIDGLKEVYKKGAAEKKVDVELFVKKFTAKISEKKSRAELAKLKRVR